MIYTDVTLVLTSCNRIEYLERTLETLEHLLPLIPNKILVDDSGNYECHQELQSLNILKDWTLILNEENIGQPASIDLAYKLVSTPYIFHLEEDWEFEDISFMDKALKILNNYKAVSQVTFRKDDPHPNEPTIYDSHYSHSFQFKEEGWRGQWFGFTHNPSLLRFSEYRKVKPYAGNQEHEIAYKYYELGFKTVTLRDKVVSHIGLTRYLNSTHKV